MMKTITKTTLLLLMIAQWSCSPAPKSSEEPTETKSEASTTTDDASAKEKESTGFDAELASKLDADKYGMKRYVIAYLKTGPNRSQTQEEANELQRAHLDNIGRLAEEGKLVLAGPFLDDGDVRGIYIFNVASLEEAAELTASDPAIQAGSLEMELHPWYGSAALQLLNDWHHKVAEEEV